MAMNNLYQYSIINALMEGICQTGISVKHTLTNGDHGLGTVPHLNGEIVIIDGEVYHFPPGEQVRKVEGGETLPFIMVTQFKPTIEKNLSSISMDLLSGSLEPVLSSRQNCFLSIRIVGLFKHLTFRVIAKQSRPRESLVELAKRQKVDTMQDIQGVMFGFWSPAFSGSFSVPGFHLHFLSKDKTKGGHIMDFDAEGVILQAAPIEKYIVELPQNEEFNQDVIGNCRAEELHAAEGR